MTNTAIWIAATVIVIAAAAAFAWYMMRQKRSKELRSRFGPEYERTVREYGDREKAESALLERQRRVQRIPIRVIAQQDRERFSGLWQDVQRRFVDDPQQSTIQADQLVSDVMRARGYPMSEFEHRAEDISVDHPEVVRNYRAAHAIALRQERGEASTEDLRQALVYYRELFDELLEAHTGARR